jgi:hypothetical protein
MGCYQTQPKKSDTTKLASPSISESPTTLKIDPFAAQNKYINPSKIQAPSARRMPLAPPPDPPQCSESKSSINEILFEHLVQRHIQLNDIGVIGAKFNRVTSLEKCGYISENDKLALVGNLEKDLNYNVESYLQHKENMSYEKPELQRLQSPLISNEEIPPSEDYTDCFIKETDIFCNIDKVQIKKQPVKRKEFSESWFKDEVAIDKAIISNNDPCIICLEQTDLTQFNILTTCKHKFHVECLKPYLIGEIKSRNIPIKCPALKCGDRIQDYELEMMLTFEEVNKYHDFALNKFLDDHHNEASRCPTPGCSCAFVYEPGISQFQCPICRGHYCLNCRVEFHRGQTCAEYRINNTSTESDKKFEQFVRGQNFKQCPQCKYWIEKSQGCNHMTCRCRNEFCYVCGQLWRKAVPCH